MLAIYTRLSKEDDESNSIENQLREGKAFAKSKNLKFVHYNEGEGVSGGAKLEKRTQLMRIMDDILERKITSVWFRASDRFSRNSETYVLFTSLCAANDIPIFYGDKEFEFRSADQELFGGIKAYLDQYKVRQQSEKTVKAIKDNFNEGKFHGIQAYGYQLDEMNHIIINDEEAKVVKRIFKLSLEGYGQRKIAEILTMDGVPTRYNKLGKGTITTKNKYTGKKTTRKKAEVTWAGNTIRSIIINTIYKGKKKTKHGIFDVPAIVTPDHWQEVNDNFKANRNNSGSSTAKYKYLLKGLIRCGRCGRNYYGRTRESKKDHYYQCSSKRLRNGNCGNRSINIDRIEELIWNDLIERGELTEMIKEHFILNQENDTLNKLNEEQIAIAQKVQSLINEKEKTIQLMVKEILEEGEGGRQLTRIRNEINSNQIQLDSISEQIAFLSANQTSMDEFISDIDNIKENTSFEDKKKLLNTHIKEIEIKSNNDFKGYTILIKFNLIFHHYFYSVDFRWKNIYKTSDIIGGVHHILESNDSISDEQREYLTKILESYDNFKNAKILSYKEFKNQQAKQ